MGGVFFYSFGISLILFLALNGNILDLIKAATPFSTRQYWFMTDYIALYIFSPFINIAIKEMTKQQYKTLLISSIILMSILPSVWFGAGVEGATKGYSLLWFITLYLIGAYIQKYDISIKKKYLIIALIIGILGTAGIKFLIAGIWQIAFNSSTNYESLAYSNNFPLMLIVSICLFMLCKDIQIKSQTIRKIIVYMAKTTLGVYLIHMHPRLANIYWGWIGSMLNFSSLTIFLWYLLSVVAVFTISMLLESLRIYIVKFIKSKIVARKILKQDNQE